MDTISWDLMKFVKREEQVEGSDKGGWEGRRDGRWEGEREEGRIHSRSNRLKQNLP